MARWVRLHLANGTFEGRRIVSPENFAVDPCRARGGANYSCLGLSGQNRRRDVLRGNGWAIIQTPNGGIVWHNGSTWGFGIHIGMSLAKDVGVIVLTNEAGGFAEAIGSWTLDRLLDNPAVDYVAVALYQTAKSEFANTEKTFGETDESAGRRCPPRSLTCNFANPSFGKAAPLHGEAPVLALQDTPRPPAQARALGWRRSSRLRVVVRLAGARP